MRTFIHYNKNGKVLSVAQIEVLAEGLEHPFVLTDETEEVLELKYDDPIAKQACHEIHDSYVVDIKKKKLKAKPR